MKPTDPMSLPQPRSWANCLKLLADGVIFAGERCPRCIANHLHTLERCPCLTQAVSASNEDLLIAHRVQVANSLAELDLLPIHSDRAECLPAPSRAAPQEDGRHSQSGTTDCVRTPFQALLSRGRRGADEQPLWPKRAIIRVHMLCAGAHLHRMPKCKHDHRVIQAVQRDILDHQCPQQPLDVATSP